MGAHLQYEQAVHSATRRTLLKIKGFSEIKVDKVKDAIAKCQVCHQPFMPWQLSHQGDNTKKHDQPAGGGFQTAHELGQQRKRVMKISTGSKQFDAILGG